MESKSDINIKYIIAIILMLFFVINDLVFDFVFNFKSSDYISFGCTLAAAIITFIATYNATKEKIEYQSNKISAFIKSNFNKWQVLFSILDIVCGIISILSGVFYLAIIFKIIKIGYIPVKFAVVVNKGKTVIKSVIKVSLLWTAGRILKKIYKKRRN